MFLPSRGGVPGSLKIGRRTRSGSYSAHPWPRRRWAWVYLALTLLTLLVNGFHPMAEDGGLYAAGIEYLLHPTLFPHGTEFVREHLRFSIFAPLLADVVRHTHGSVRGVLLGADLLTIAATMWAAGQVLRRVVATDAAQAAGLVLLAMGWCLPVAGTSLLMMDPYVTARSFAVPLSVLALALALDPWERRELGGWTSAAGCLGALGVAALFHPLMAGYGAAFVLLVRLTRRPHHRSWWAATAIAAVGLAAVLQTLAAPESQAVRLAEFSRYYWFLSQWRWFELVGLAGPMLVLLGVWRWRRAAGLLEPASTLLRAALVLGGVGILIAVLFAREAASRHLVARLQPLRVFLYLYLVMTVLLGPVCWQVLKRWPAGRTVRAAMALAGASALGFGMYMTQRAAFPASPHIEWPWQTAANPNPWVQAFLWARDHTPEDAVFTLDARYVNTEGEDAQTFRAIALRSALPDYSKDGGEASITPALAERWLAGAEAQRHLAEQPDSSRDTRLRALGATWMIVASGAPTAHPCPYRNGTVKVCRLDLRAGAR